MIDREVINTDLIDAIPVFSNHFNVIDITTLNVLEYMNIIINRFGFDDNVTIVLPSWLCLKIIYSGDSLLAQKTINEWKNGFNIFDIKINAYKVKENEDSYIVVYSGDKIYYLKVRYCAEP